MFFILSGSLFEAALFQNPKRDIISDDFTCDIIVIRFWRGGFGAF
jgi:hypothetical protein